MLNPFSAANFYNKWEKPADWPELKDTYDYEIVDDEKGKYTVVGSPTINGKVVSGFSSSDYLSTSVFNPGNNTWELGVKIKYKQKSENNYILGHTSSFLIKCWNNRLGMSIKESGSSAWNYNQVSSYQISEDEIIWVHLIFDGSSYKLSYSSDGVTYTELLSYISANNIVGTYAVFLGNPAESYFPGSIDLSETYIKVNGHYFFDGSSNGARLIGCNENIYLSKINNAYINTGYIPNNDSGFKITVFTGEYPNESIPVGCRHSTVDNTRFYIDFKKYDSNTLRVWWGWNQYSSSNLPLVNTKCSFSLNFYNDRKRRYNDIIDGAITEQLLDIDQPLTLFRYNNKEGEFTYGFGYKLFNIKITEGSLLIRHFIPVPAGLQIGTYIVPSNGMWDIVEQKFYGNAGTGEFKIGKDKPADNSSLEVKNGKLVGPVGYTVVGNPTIVDEVMTYSNVSNYVRTRQNFLRSYNDYEIVCKCAKRLSTEEIVYCMSTGNNGNLQARLLSNAFRFIPYTFSDYIQISGTFATDVWYWFKVRRTGNTIYASYSTDGVSWSNEVSKTFTQLTTNSNWIAFGTRVVSDSDWNGTSIDLNETYIKVNGHTWFGNSPWEPCTFEDNAIYLLAGHKSDYSQYDDFKVTPSTKDSGTYDVWIDNEKYGTFNRGTELSIKWSDLSLSTGWNITTPESVKAHSIKLKASSNSNKIDSLYFNGSITSGLLYNHFQLDYEFDFTRAGGGFQHTPLMLGTTAKNNKLNLMNILSNMSYYSYYGNIKYFPIIKSKYKHDFYYEPFTSFKTKSIKFEGDKFYSINCSQLERLYMDNPVIVGDSFIVKNLRQLPKLIFDNTKVLNNAFILSNLLNPTNIDFSDSTTIKRFRGYSTPGIKSVRVSPEAPFSDTSTPQINVGYTGQNRLALRNLFDSMPYNCGYNVVGSPTINSGVVSGFSANDYLSLDLPFNIGGNWEMVFKVKFTSYSGIFFGYQCGSSSGLSIEPSKTIHYWVDSKAANKLTGTHEYSLNTDYYIKVIKNYNLVSLYYSTDNTNFTLDTSKIITDLNDNSATNINLGCSFNGSSPFDGSIDLNRTYIKVHSPISTGGTDYTIIGNPTINNGIVSGMSNSDYIKVTGVDATSQIVEVKTKFSGSSNLSGNTDLVFISNPGTGSLGFYQTIGGSIWVYDNNHYWNLLQNDSNILDEAKPFELLFNIKDNTLYGKVIQENAIVAEKSTSLSTFSSFTPSVDSVIHFGWPYLNVYPDSIDLNSTYIKINNKIFFGHESSLVPFFRGTAHQDKVIDITGSLGANQLEEEDVNVVIKKGWTLTGAQVRNMLAYNLPADI